MFSAAVLARLEEDLDLRIVDHFDLIAGTSTGGILVSLLPIAKESITQAGLKQRVGDMLVAYVRSRNGQGHTDGPKSCRPRRRCWTLGYPDHGFHLDVLPAIPDVDYAPTGILLTDVELREWQHSNPIGYATWFRNRGVAAATTLTAEEMGDQEPRLPETVGDGQDGQVRPADVV